MKALTRGRKIRLSEMNSEQQVESPGEEESPSWGRELLCEDLWNHSNRRNPQRREPDRRFTTRAQPDNT